MRKPRDLHNYVPASDAALALRSIADVVAVQRHVHPLVKFSITMGYWNPEWQDKTKRQPVAIKTGEQLYSRDKRLVR